MTSREPFCIGTELLTALSSQARIRSSPNYEWKHAIGETVLFDDWNMQLAVTRFHMKAGNSLEHGLTSKSLESYLNEVNRLS